MPGEGVVTGTYKTLAGMLFGYPHESANVHDFTAQKIWWVTPGQTLDRAFVDQDPTGALHGTAKLRRVNGIAAWIRIFTVGPVKSCQQRHWLRSSWSARWFPSSVFFGWSPKSFSR